ncbi:MAG: hypothetical protein M3N13_06565 [Candidatus Eremiobacteraeota bacterium]|nr:hypothetical protein [Candidatus Eremiobacteraeota bacterium]
MRLERLMVPDGLGMFIDRGVFDDQLRGAASSQGAVILSDHGRAAARNGNTWYVDLCRSTLESQYLVDASGRACWFTRRHVALPVLYDSLVGVRVEAENEIDDRETVIAPAA